MHINRLQVEVTLKCVDEPCRFCNRRFLMDHDLYQESNIRKDDIIKVFTDNDIDGIQFCANAGEASFHEDFTEIIRAARRESNEIEWNTNGSQMSNEWWYDLGKLLDRDKDLVVFGIDGLNEATHCKHRHNDFQKVYSNMVSFIKGGGNASWQFIVFKHNEHEIELVKKAAKIIGCKQVIIRNSRRYNDEFQKPSSDVINYSHDRRTIFHEKFEKDIECTSLPPINMFFIDANGYFWPCCTIAGYHQIDKIADKINVKGEVLDEVFKIFEEEKDMLNIYNEHRLHKIIENSKMFKYIYDNIDNQKCCDYYCNKNRNLDDRFSRIETL